MIKLYTNVCVRTLNLETTNGAVTSSTPGDWDSPEMFALLSEFFRKATADSKRGKGETWWSPFSLGLKFLTQYTYEKEKIYLVCRKCVIFFSFIHPFPSDDLQTRRCRTAVVSVMYIFFFPIPIPATTSIIMDPRRNLAPSAAWGRTGCKNDEIIYADAEAGPWPKVTRTALSTAIII